MFSYIIDKTQKLSFHTNLNQLLIPIIDDISCYDWIISDLEIMGHKEGILEDLSDQVISYEIFKKLIESKDLQVIWGVFTAIPKSSLRNEDIKSLVKVPFADGNSSLWKKPLEFQYQEAEVEIVYFDSSYTIIKFKDERMTNKFKDYFKEALKIEDYISQNLV